MLQLVTVQKQVNVQQNVLHISILGCNKKELLHFLSTDCVCASVYLVDLEMSPIPV